MIFTTVTATTASSDIADTNQPTIVKKAISLLKQTFNRGGNKPSFTKWTLTSEQQQALGQFWQELINTVSPNELALRRANYKLKNSLAENQRKPNFETFNLTQAQVEEFNSRWVEGKKEHLASGRTVLKQAKNRLTDNFKRGRDKPNLADLPLSKDQLKELDELWNEKTRNISPSELRFREGLRRVYIAKSSKFESEPNFNDLSLTPEQLEDLKLRWEEDISAPSIYFSQGLSVAKERFRDAFQLKLNKPSLDDLDLSKAQKVEMNEFWDKLVLKGDPSTYHLFNQAKAKINNNAHQHRDKPDFTNAPFTTEQFKYLDELWQRKIVKPSASKSVFSRAKSYLISSAQNNRSKPKFAKRQLTEQQRGELDALWDELMLKKNPKDKSIRKNPKLYHMARDRLSNAIRNNHPKAAIVDLPQPKKQRSMLDEYWDDQTNKTRPLGQQALSVSSLEEDAPHHTMEEVSVQVSTASDVSDDSDSKKDFGWDEAIDSEEIITDEEISTIDSSKIALAFSSKRKRVNHLDPEMSDQETISTHETRARHKPYNHYPAIEPTQTSSNGKALLLSAAKVISSLEESKIAELASSRSNTISAGVMPMDISETKAAPVNLQMAQTLFGRKRLRAKSADADVDSDTTTNKYNRLPLP